MVYARHVSAKKIAIDDKMISFDDCARTEVTRTEESSPVTQHKVIIWFPLFPFHGTYGLNMYILLHARNGWKSKVLTIYLD